MKRTLLFLLLGLASLAACTVDDLSTAFDEPITSENGVIIDHYPYLWVRPHSADSAGTAARVEFKTFDYSLPMFDNGGKVIVGNTYGGITCLETTGGNVVWTCKLTDDFLTKPILDYIIASNGQWIIVNMEGNFIKIDLKTGKILGQCTIASHAKSRMYRDGDYQFYLAGKLVAYRVDCQSMIAVVDEMIDITIQYQHIAIIPFTHNNTHYKLVQEVTPAEGVFENIKTYIISKNDTLYYNQTTTYNSDYIEYIDEYKSEIYLFNQSGFTIFDLKTMSIVHQENNTSYIGYRYHEFYNDKLIYHNRNESFIEVVFDTNNRIRLIESDELGLSSDEYQIHLQNRFMLGTKLFDGIIYSSRGKFLKASEFETFRWLLKLEFNFTSSSDNKIHPLAVGKNTSNKTIIVVDIDGMVLCYPGL